MNTAQRWILIGAVMSIVYRLRAPATPPAPHEPWISAAVSVVGLLAVWFEGRRGHRGALSERQRSAMQWWVASLAVSLIASVATLAVGIVLPRWLGMATLFPLFAAIFVSAGEMTPEASESHGKVMRVLTIFSLAGFGVAAVIALFLSR
jgi:hypothetical protein